MKCFGSSALLVLLAFASNIWAQSVVFLPATESSIGYSRPRPVSKPRPPLAMPQAIPPTPSSDFPNINISSFLLVDQNEPSIAINPTDANNLLVGANDYRSDSSLFYFASTDGGLHWHGNSLPSKAQYALSAFNPSMAFNANGKAFFTYGRAHISAIGNPYDINDVACFTNDAKGDSASWKGPVKIHFDSLDQFSANTFADKFYTAVDQSASSPFKGRIYTAWVEYIVGEKNHIVLSYSTNEGQLWTSPISLTDTGNYQSPIPAVGPTGDVYVSFLDLDTNHLNIHCTKSTDGGVSFQKVANKIVSAYKNLGSIDSTGAYAHPVLKGHLRVSSFPSIGVDHSASHPGRIYLTWAGKGNDNKLHIFLSISNDAAATWSAPKEIENDNGSVATDKFLPWLAVDKVNGDIGVVYYDSRNDSVNNIFIDTYLSFSRDGGLTFTPLRITPSSFDPTVSSVLDGTFIGDYINLAAVNKHWYPVWSDTRVGYDQDLYLAIVRPYAPSSAIPFTATEETTTHFASLHWQHTPVTTAQLPLGNHKFHLWREDKVLDTLLPSSERSFVDVLANETSNHRYFLQVVADDGDTSTTVTTGFYPRAMWEPRPPELLSSKAQSGGFEATIKLPEKNIAGQPLEGLSKLYRIVDGQLFGNPFDAKNPGDEIQPFFSFSENGFHKVQLAAATEKPDGDTVLSVLTEPCWLYAGNPASSYSENFLFGNSTFTPFRWTLTNVGDTAYINDSLPNVNYPSDEQTWFVLPPVHVLNETQTLEFDHIAAVATGDSAIVEYSLDNGVHYTPNAFYDRQQHADLWQLSLIGSSPVHQKIAYKYFKDRDIVTRFKLATHSSSGDGWFITNIAYTDFASVHKKEKAATAIRIKKNPIYSDQDIELELTRKNNSIASISLYDFLGRKRLDIPTQLVTAGSNRFTIKAPEESGAYVIVIQFENNGSIDRYTASVIVLP